MSDELLIVGSLVAIAGVALALLAEDRPSRLFGMALGLLVSAILVCSLAWEGPLAELRDRPLVFGAVSIVAASFVVGIAFAFVRRPLAFPLAAVAALPFRVPVELGGETSNLLLPLYLVVAAGLGAAIYRARLNEAEPARSPRLLRIALVVSVAAYGLASTYSLDTEAAVEAIVFFLVPFATLFCLLEEVSWTRRLLVTALAIVVAEAVLFAVVAIGQQLYGGIFWNESLIASNEFHFYLRSNSLFWDPNVFGRYAAIAVILGLSAATWISRGRSAQVVLVAAVGLAWVGLLFSWSQSGFISLLAGLLVLCALRYGARLALIATPAVAALLVLGVFLGASPDTDRSVGDEATSGRSSLVSGGLRLAGERPIYGWGAGAFPEAFARAEDVADGQTTVSHNEPVTVLAEQGLLGFAAYAFLLIVSARVLFGSMRCRAPGLGGEMSALDWALAGRVALASAGVALFVHTLAYAGNLTDPLTWALLAVAGVLYTTRQGN